MLCDMIYTLIKLLHIKYYLISIDIIIDIKMLFHLLKQMWKVFYYFLRIQFYDLNHNNIFHQYVNNNYNEIIIKLWIILYFY